MRHDPEHQAGTSSGRQRTRVPLRYIPKTRFTPLPKENTTMGHEIADSRREETVQVGHGSDNRDEDLSGGDAAEQDRAQAEDTAPAGDQE